MAPLEANTRGATTPVLAHLGRCLATMPPAYFAMSMATGIVSIACHDLQMGGLSRLLFWVNVLAFGGLWVATALRAILFRQAFLGDWGSHQRAPGFFTAVAATCVVGTQFVVIAKVPEIGLGLWFFALGLWMACTYVVFLALIVRTEKPTLDDGINGGWLVASVATQGICVLGCAVLGGRGSGHEAAAFLLLCFWLCGGMLYLWIISLIFYRYTFFPIGPASLLPTYWINMGAVAIATLAGTSLVALAPHSALLTEMLPFVKGLTSLAWAIATWWIPLLIGLGIWRHVVHRYAVSYDAQYWGLVFPIGMYAVCTNRLALVLDLEQLRWLAGGIGLAAVLSWTTTCFGLLAQFVYTGVLALRSPRRAASSGAHPLALSSSTLEPTCAPIAPLGGPK